MNTRINYGQLPEEGTLRPYNRCQTFVLPLGEDTPTSPVYWSRPSDSLTCGSCQLIFNVAYLVVKESGNIITVMGSLEIRDKNFNEIPIIKCRQ